tara:strand:- start:186 stop:575 length:390 start_codon:yes stop_codon:yes gene_type:complete
MPVTGVKQVKQNMKRVFKDISDKKAPQFINTVLSIGAANSKELTPIEYSTLVNSQMINVDITGEKIAGFVSFNTNYAAALEFGAWKPVAAVNKEGPADNMKAEPHFLRKGFESPESQSQIKQAEKIFKI